MPSFYNSPNVGWQKLFYYLQVSFKTPSPTVLDRSDGWTSQKSVQQQPVASSLQPSLPSPPQHASTASASFSQPPPPLQQLQEQAQARVVHVPPPPIFPLPPMSVPPPNIRPNMLDASGPNFVVSENAMVGISYFYFFHL